MKAETKHAGKILVAIAILLIAIFTCAALICPNVAQCSEEVVNNDISLLSQSAAEDYSSYTDQTLPNEIDRTNIKQYVPIDIFNTSGITIYNGRNYGFIIYSNANTNHVLLFKETYTKIDSREYEVEFKVVYTNAFFKLGNSILNANSPYTIALSNISISEFILDADMQNNIANQSYDNKISYSPYFYKTSLSGDISFLDKDKTRDQFLVNTLDVEPTINSDNILDYSASDVTINAVNNIRNSKTSNIGTVSYNYNTNLNAIELSVDAGADDFLAYKSGKQDYIKASFTVDGVSNHNYYIYNNISFNICLYNSIQVKKEDRVSSESVFAPSAYSTSEYGILDRSNDGYTLKECQRFEPLLNNLGVFNFSPDKARDYRIKTPEGYYSTVNDKTSNSENVFAVSGQSNTVGFTTELDNKSNASTHEERLVAQDFIGGNIRFANIAIEREQELKLGDTYLNSEIPIYRAVKMSNICNNLFTLDTTGYVGNISLHILDEDLNIIQTSPRYGKELVINYPFAADKKYYIVCDNQSYTAQALQFNDKNVLELGDKNYPSIENIYYKYTVPRYSQYYYTFAKQVIDEQGSAVPINDGDVFLEAGKTYYLQSGISRLMTNISDSHVKEIVRLDESVECAQEFNDVFEFVPKVSAQYSFADGTYDVYRNWTLIAEDVDTIYINESTIAYQFVKRQKGGNFVLDIQGEELSLGLNNLSQSASGRSQYIFNADEKMRIEYTVNPTQNVYIYDAYLNLLEFDHGYPLQEGKNYIFVEGAGTINIEEYLQRVQIDLYVDGAKYDYNRDFYYGKDLILPVPVKERYNFIGWRDENGLVTDSNGQGLAEISEESMILTAVWQLRGIVIKVSSNGEFWWNGQAMVNQEVSPVFVDEDIDSVYNKVVSLIESTPECIAEGYYNAAYRFDLTSSDALNDYYSLTASTVKEKYRIRFEILGSYYYTSSSVAYGDSITYSNFPQQVLDWSNREYAITGWRLSGSQNEFAIRNGKTVVDFTPGIGSNNGTLGYVNIYLTAIVEYVSYKFNINGNLYEVPRTHSYKIETLEDYGYNASSYYGYNVSFQGSKGEVYYIDDAVFVSDLYDYWTYGMTNVNIDLKTVAQAIMVNINYIAYGDGFSIVLEKNTNATYYQGGNAYRLSSVEAKGWKFDCWKYNNTKITELTYSTLGVTRYYSQSGSIVLYRNVTTEFTAYKIESPKSGTIRVDSPIGVARIYGKGSGLSNFTFIIAPSITEVTFVGGVWYDTDIQVEDNEKSVILYFDSVYIKAKKNQCVLYSDRYMEFLYSFGTTELVAGDVTEEGAQAAIVAKENLAFVGDKFIIRGGNSTDPYIKSTNGIKCDNIILSGAKMLEVYGGNGAPGSSHPSGHGGHGATAIYANGMATIVNGSQIICYGGNGGSAVNNGQGGNGAVAATLRIAPPSQCIITYVPGKGGIAQGTGISGKDGDKDYLLY